MDNPFRTFPRANMSRKEAGDAARSGGTSGSLVLKPLVALPTLPRCEDGNRQKWMAEYDKVEAELLKPHLASAGCPTATLGLRQLPASWDSSVQAASAGGGGSKGHGTTSADTEEAADDGGGAPYRLHKGAAPHRAASSLDGSQMPPHKGGKGGKGAHPNGLSPRRPLSASSTARSVTGALHHAKSPSRSSHNAMAAVTSPVPANPATPAGRAQLHATLQTLFTLIEPPVAYRTAYHLDLTGIDLKWLTRYVSGDRPPTLLTLETIREDMLISAATQQQQHVGGGAATAGGRPSHDHTHDVALNSPRSVVILLRNGITVQDVQIKPRGKTIVPAVSSTPGGHQSSRSTSPDSSAELAEHRRQLIERHEEERRKQLLQSLRQEYRDLCTTMPLFTLLDEITAWKSSLKSLASHERDDLLVDEGSNSGGTPRSKGAAAATSTKSKREVHAERRQRAARFAAELDRKAQEAELRQLSRDQEMTTYRQQKREETSERAKQAARRLAEMRAALNDASEAQQAEAVQRLEMMAAKEAQREEQRRQRAAEREADIERMADVRRQRIEQARQQVQQQLEAQQSLAAEKERQAQEKREQMQHERLSLRVKLEADQRRAEQLREAARLKARQREEDERRVAEERNMKAEQQLRMFTEMKLSQRAEAAAAERQKREQRQKAFEQTQQQEEYKRESSLSKRRQHEADIHAQQEERRRHMLEENTLRAMQAQDKQFLVDRQAKAAEFFKVVAVGMLSQKARRADLASMSRKRGTSPT